MVKSHLFDFLFFFFQAEDGIRDDLVTGVQTCALPISIPSTQDARSAFALPAPRLLWSFRKQMNSPQEPRAHVEALANPHTLVSRRARSGIHHCQRRDRKSVV